MNQQQQEQLFAMRDKLIQEIAMLNSRLSGTRERLAGLEAAIAVLTGTTAALSSQSTVSASADRLPRGGVKGTVLRIVEENAQSGVSAGELVDLASAQGIALERGSISSLLSKLKAAGTLDLIGNRYRPAKPHSNTTLYKAWPAEPAVA